MKNWINKIIDIPGKTAKYELEGRESLDKIYLKQYGKTFRQWCNDYFWERYMEQFHRELVAKKFLKIKGKMNPKIKLRKKNMFYVIKGNASKVIVKVYEDTIGVSFYAIFNKKEEAEKVLNVLGNAMWHIEKIEVPFLENKINFKLWKIQNNPTKN